MAGPRFGFKKMIKIVFFNNLSKLIVSFFLSLNYLVVGLTPFKNHEIVISCPPSGVIVVKLTIRFIVGIPKLDLNIWLTYMVKKLMMGCRGTL